MVHVLHVVHAMDHGLMHEHDVMPVMQFHDACEHGT